MRDGFAVRAEDLVSVPATLKCLGELRAGEVSKNPVGSGEAMQIMTGAPVPEGANAVVMVEHTERPSEDEVRILKTVQPGGNVAPKGSERLSGDVVFGPGERISSFELAVLASVGKATVSVFRSPSVSILATGDEIVEISETPGFAQIRNSNSISLYGQVRKKGGVPKILKTARDHLDDLRRQIASGLESDILLVTGGVSMGKYDLVEPVFKELGVTVHFDSVNMRPGKPTVFATRKGRCVFGLPGNPVSAFVAFELFVTPVLRALQGLPAETLSLIRGVLSSAVREKSGRTAFLPARVEFQRGMVEIAPVNWKGSADIFSPVNANALLIVPSEVSNFQTGDEADALLFDEVEHVMETCF